MRRIFALVYSEIRGLHQSAYILAIFALASQLLALVRDRLFAHTFGAGAELDLYYAAFRIPDTLFVLFASILSVYVLVPFISERLSESDHDGAAAVLSTVLSVFIYAYATAALIVFVFARPLSVALFPGFSPENYDTLTMLLRIMLLQPFLLGISNLCGVVTQLGQRFVLYAISPLLYNLGIIAGVLCLYPMMGLPGLVWGVVFGAVLHALIQVPFIATSDLAPKLRLGIDRRVLSRILLNSTPRALTLSLGQIVLLAFVGIASMMVAGSVSVFQFAYNLQSVPLTIIGVSYSVAAFPILARLYSNGERDAFLARVSSALRHIVFWTFPAIALIIVVRAQLVRVILGSGAFDWDDTRLTAAALALFAISLASQSINLLIVRAFYAAGNTKTPFVAALVASMVTLATAFGLHAAYLSSGFGSAITQLLRVDGVLGAEILMLPLAFSIVSLFHAAYLLYAFARQTNLALAPLAASFYRAFLAALGGGLAAYIALNTVVAGVRVETFAGILVQGAVASIVGLAFTVALFTLMRSPELAELWTTFRRRVSGKLLGTDGPDALGL